MGTNVLKYKENTIYLRVILDRNLTFETHTKELNQKLAKYTQFCRIKGCGGTGWPPPIIFERLKLPQQIIYLRKRNLSESPNHF